MVDDAALRRAISGFADRCWEGSFEQAAITGGVAGVIDRAAGSAANRREWQRRIARALPALVAGSYQPELAQAATGGGFARVADVLVAHGFGGRLRTFAEIAAGGITAGELAILPTFAVFRELSPRESPRVRWDRAHSFHRDMEYTRQRFRHRASPSVRSELGRVLARKGAGRREASLDAIAACNRAWASFGLSSQRDQPPAARLLPEIVAEASRTLPKAIAAELVALLRVRSRPVSYLRGVAALSDAAYREIGLARMRLREREPHRSEELLQGDPACERAVLERARDLSPRRPHPRDDWLAAIRQDAIVTHIELGGQNGPDIRYSGRLGSPYGSTHEFLERIGRLYGVTLAMRRYPRDVREARFDLPPINR